MNKKSTGFTFLHRIKEVELNIRDGRWQSALALSLTLPDICGGIAFPELIKRYRDGRIVLDKQKNPSRDVGGQYIRWFDEFAAPFFKISPQDSSPYICGERCWQLRCEYLHQNKGFLNETDDSSVRFHLGVNCGTSLCQFDKHSMTNNGMDIRIDIEQFCLRMCQAAENYYNSFHLEKNFDMYNTPVLDFIQITQPPISDRLIALICPDATYSKALELALQSVTRQISVFKTASEAEQALKKKNVALWILAEPFPDNISDFWNVVRNDSTLLLTDRIASELLIPKPEKTDVLSFPVLPAILRSTARKYI